MKRIAVLILCMALLCACAGCGTSGPEIEVKDGIYYLTGDYEEHMTPYLHLNTEEKSFMMGAGMVISYAEYGTYEIRENQLIAISQTTTFILEIEDDNTLILVDNGDNVYFKLQKDGKFVYSGN